MRSAAAAALQRLQHSRMPEEFRRRQEHATRMDNKRNPFAGGEKNKTGPSVFSRTRIPPLKRAFLSQRNEQKKMINDMRKRQGSFRSRQLVSHDNHVLSLAAAATILQNQGGGKAISMRRARATTSSPVILY